MRTVLGYLRPYAWRAAAGAAIKFTAAILELVLPLLLARIIDELVPAGDLPAIWRAGGLMALLAVGALACNVTANCMAAWVSMRMTQTLRQDLYHRVQGLSCAQADRFSPSSLVSRLTNDTYNVHQMFDKVQRGGIRAPMLVLGGLVLTFLLEPALALIQLAVSALTILTVTLVTRRGIPHYARAQAAVDTVVRILRENAAGVRVIKALVCQERERARFESANQENRRAEERAGLVMALANPITDLLLNAGLALVVLAGAFRVNAGLMPAGQIVAFTTYFALIQSATLGIAKVFVKISKGVASARRIQEVLLAPEDQTREAPREPGPGYLGMERVSFSYLGERADVSDLSFSLPRGGMLGILGPTGSGKSTLAALLPRLYDADRGVVWVGGADVKAQDRRALQSGFGVVFQNDSLIGGTVYENISFLRGLSREAVESAARAAQAYSEDSAPGAGHALDLRGANLSGGQRQRLLIARALAGRPEILVLDGADSALDYATAAALRRDVRAAFPDVTLVVISERISAVRAADRILLLLDGRIDAQGSHEGAAALQQPLPADGGAADGRCCRMKQGWLRRLWRFLRPHAPALAAAAALAAASGLLALLVPLFSGWAVGAVGTEAGRVDLGRVALWCAGAALAAALSALFAYGAAAVLTRAAQAVSYELRKAAFRRISELPVQYFDTHPAGDLISRVCYDVDTVNAALSTDLLQIGTSVLTVAGSFVMLLLLSPSWPGCSS